MEVVHKVDQSVFGIYRSHHALVQAMSTDRPQHHHGEKIQAKSIIVHVGSDVRRISF